MIKTTILSAAAVIIILLAACAGIDRENRPGQDNLIFLDGIVQAVSGKQVWLTLKVPEIKKTTGSAISDIAQQIVQKSLLFEGVTTEVNDQQARVMEVRGTAVKIELEKPIAFAAGTMVKLQVPKKSIAIVDFEVIRGSVKEVGRVTLEELTTTLVESGQFNVVERSKLKSIMDELQLSLSGMAGDTADKFSGKLLIADLILTGTLADIQNEWNINLRLINTRTGQAVAAVFMKTKLFNAAELRDSGSWNEDFEAARVDPSWLIGYHRLGKQGQKSSAFYETALDTNTGAEGSKQSLRIKFKFTGDTPGTYAIANNKRKRNISLFSGIEFYAKGTRNLYGTFRSSTSLPDDPNTMDRWVSFFDISTEWQKIRIPFDSLTIGRGWIKRGAESMGAKAGDQVIRLNRIEELRFDIDSDRNEATEGTVWIDKISFYRD
jgi:TolB-like protein